MTLELFWSAKIDGTSFVRIAFSKFAQCMANRLLQGHVRYGAPDADKRYMTRLILETKAYKRTGNREHLYNIANYCVLECITPENNKHHLDASVDSVTRKRMGV